ncbi:MAG: bifunctional heptose 7-phosphate kinase/heptose 1-phosphate adenyltransferase [Candidatus Thorarchaeota archaeon]
MTIVEKVGKWKNKRILIIGDALIDRYIIGNADKISPDAPVPNVKIEKSEIYLGAIGLVLQFIKSLGGIPEICAVVGDDYEGEFFIKKVRELNINHHNILIDENINTPQITRIKAKDQHLLRLETDYSNQISNSIREDLLDKKITAYNNIESIILLDYGINGIFDDHYIPKMLQVLRDNYKDVPIIVRPNLSNYYLFENIDLMKINLQKSLQNFSIKCCNDTSITIAGKRIINSSKCKALLLNYLELDSYLFYRKQERVEKIKSILDKPVRGYIAVGSVIMAVLGLISASKIPLLDGVKIAMFAAALSATLPQVEFFNSKVLENYILKYEKDKL